MAEEKYTQDFQAMGFGVESLSAYESRWNDIKGIMVPRWARVTRTFSVGQTVGQCSAILFLAHDMPGVLLYQPT